MRRLAMLAEYLGEQVQEPAEMGLIGSGILVEGMEQGSGAQSAEWVGWSWCFPAIPGRGLVVDDDDELDDDFDEDEDDDEDDDDLDDDDDDEDDDDFA